MKVRALPLPDQSRFGLPENIRFAVSRSSPIAHEKISAVHYSYVDFRNFNSISKVLDQFSMLLEAITYQVGQRNTCLRLILSRFTRYIHSDDYPTTALFWKFRLRYMPFRLMKAKSRKINTNILISLKSLEEHLRHLYLVLSTTYSHPRSVCSVLETFEAYS